jgi:hypothetical protein
LSVTSSGSGGNLNWPRTPFIDQQTMMPSLPWLLWLQNPSVNSFSSANALAPSSGGTGVATTPTNGQLLIGNSKGYTLNTLTAGTAIGVTNGTGSITLNNLGVTSLIAGTGIGVSSATGAVTVSNTGVLSFSAGATGFTPSSATTGAVTLGGILNLTNGGTGASTAAGARTNLGLGTIATQNANNVAITGGSISGVSASVTTLTTSSTITANNIATTGTHITIAKWLPVVCDGTTYYIPLYT